MPPAAPRISGLLGVILVLAACGTTASPSANPRASATPESASAPPDLNAVVCAPVAKPFDPDAIDLTGAWAGNDGGIYFLRQVGSVMWGNGMSGREGSPMDLGREWNNIVRGVIDGLQIDVEWADMPRGEILNHGTSTLNIQDDGRGNIQLVLVSTTGEFAYQVWTPCLPVELRVAEYVETYGGAVREYADILTANACDVLTELKSTVMREMNTADAGSPEFRAALGYSNAISERQLALDC